MEPPQFSLPNQPGQSNLPAQPPHVNNPLAVMQPDEQIICELKRHPIGMLGAYLASGTILVILAILAFIVAPSIFGVDNRTQVIAGASVVFIVVAIVILAFVFITNIVYWGNRWVVTSDSLTQISQTGLFSKQSAQLSLGNLEDVTVEQNGILAQMFKFGVLKAETAGERSKFVFPFCPNPSYYAQKILAAREQFEQVHHGGKQVPYVAPATSMPPDSVPAPTIAQTPTTAPTTNDPQWPQSQIAEPSQYQVGQSPPDFSVLSQTPVSPDQPPSGASLASPDAEPTYNNAPTPDQTQNS